MNKYEKFIKVANLTFYLFWKMQNKTASYILYLRSFSEDAVSKTATERPVEIYNSLQQQKNAEIPPANTGCII